MEVLIPAQFELAFAGHSNFQATPTISFAMSLAVDGEPVPSMPENKMVMVSPDIVRALLGKRLQVAPEHPPPCAVGSCDAVSS